jgi:hypothetical protein
MGYLPAVLKEATEAVGFPVGKVQGTSNTTGRRTEEDRARVDRESGPGMSFIPVTPPVCDST